MAAQITYEEVKHAESLATILNAMDTEIDAIRTLVNELRTDHATFKTVVDELTAWAETLAAKLNVDLGVNDTDYDAVITADAPATITAGAVTEQVTKGT